MTSANFKALDANGDGAISPVELRQAKITLSDHERKILTEAHSILGRLKARYLATDAKLERRPIEVEAAAIAVGAILTTFIG